jgi:hypothetical protein
VLAVMLAFTAVSLVAGGAGAAGRSAARSGATADGAPKTRIPSKWPFSEASPWNAPMGANATFSSANDPRTQNLVDPSIVAGINAAEYSHPIYVAKSSDPMRSVRVKVAPTGIEGSGIAEYDVVARFRIPKRAEPAPGEDAHLHVVDPDGRTLHETWMFAKSGSELTAAGYARTDLLGSGVSSVNGRNVGMRAYGGSAIGGLIRTWEVKADAIRHVLAIALTNNQLKRGWVWPATQEDSGSSTYAGQIPMGSLVAIPPSVDLTALDLSDDGLVLAKALQDYGAYVVDRSGGFTFYAEPGAESRLGSMRRDVNKIREQLRLVTNNGPSSVGGGGTPRAPLAPPFRG